MHLRSEPNTDGAVFCSPACIDCMRVTTAAEAPYIAEAAFSIPYREDGGGAFMAAHRTAKLVSRTRLSRQWPEYTVVLMSDDGDALARAVSIPYATRVAGRELFPDGGWEQVVLWAIEDVLDQRTPDALCALEIAVASVSQRQGISALALRAMLANAAERGYARLLAPVRPPLKATRPWTPMEDYAAEVRDDGLPSDPWLRVHARAGGQIRRIAKTSAVIAAELAAWRQWTDLPLDVDGAHAVPGGLVPITVSTHLGVATYVEPNVWVEHHPRQTQTPPVSDG